MLEAHKDCNKLQRGCELGGGAGRDTASAAAWSGRLRRTAPPNILPVAVGRPRRGSSSGVRIVQPAVTTDSDGAGACACLLALAPRPAAPEVAPDRTAWGRQRSTNSEQGAGESGRGNQR